MLTKKDILKKIQHNVEAIKTYGVKKVGIFGSVARSNQHRNSDIDILVEFEAGNKTFDNYMGLKLHLEKLFHRKVDLVIKGALKARIRERVLTETAYARL